MKIFASGFLLVLVLTSCSVSFSPEPQADLPRPTAGTATQQVEAADAARQYLALIDNKEYEKTWDRAGSVLRATTNKFMWTGVLKTSSHALGSPTRREIEGFGFTTQIDAAVPVGDYVMVQFKSKSGNTTLTEKVVMQKEQGSWKIIGYFAAKRAEFGASN
jgi:hypothetical protein